MCKSMVHFGWCLQLPAQVKKSRGFGSSTNSLPTPHRLDKYRRSAQRITMHRSAGAGFVSSLCG